MDTTTSILATPPLLTPDPDTWPVPAPKCPKCGSECKPVAESEGHWSLFFACCDAVAPIDWPFGDQEVAGPSDFEALGFEIRVRLRPDVTLPVDDLLSWTLGSAMTWTENGLTLSLRVHATSALERDFRRSGEAVRRLLEHPDIKADVDAGAGRIQLHDILSTTFGSGE